MHAVMATCLAVYSDADLNSGWISMRSASLCVYCPMDDVAPWHGVAVAL